MTQQNTIKQLVNLANNNQKIEVMWLYGSRANGTAETNSDYDVAIAFQADKSEENPLQYPCEDLQYQWSKNTSESIPIVDINKVPTPLAHNVINEGKVIYCNNDLRLHTEQHRVWSKWESYKQNYGNIKQSYEAYLLAIQEQLQQHLAALQQLSEILQKRHLTFNERSATERSLQVIIEAAIGCSKHYLKSKNKPVPSDARTSIERVYELLAITNPEISEMRGAIGMRNAIIHDYLNLEWQKLEMVLKQKKYYLIETYINLVSSKLFEINKN